MRPDLYTVVLTRILGSQQTTTEHPCPNISTFYNNREFLDGIAGTQDVQYWVSHCPYGTISSATRRSEYFLATIHRNPKYA